MAGSDSPGRHSNSRARRLTHSEYAIGLGLRKSYHAAKRRERSCHGGRSRPRISGWRGGTAWLGWTPDAFDFATFLLIMVPIGNESKVPLGFMSGVLQGPVEHWLP
jgi:hypothetical protein